MSLLPHHEAQLKSIAADVAVARGYQSVSPPSNADNSSRELLKRCGFSSNARKENKRFPGLLIPVYGPTGRLATHRYRPDRPREVKGKAVKYEAPMGRASSVDVHPFHKDTIADPTVQLIITEGHKKADAITTAARAEGIATAVAAIDGVYNWRSRHGTLGEWEDIPLRGRDVLVLFDEDAATNRNVAAAMSRLGKWLRSKGAKPRYIVCPAVNGYPKAGADDYLGTGGTLAALLALAETRPPDPGAGDITLTDAIVAESIARDVLEDEYRWCSGLGGWHRWTGIIWDQVPEEEVLEQVRQYLIAMHKQALDDRPDADRLKRLSALQSKGRAKSILDYTKGMGGVLTEPEEFDADKDLLNCPNGVVDTRTGELLEHDPDLLMTLVTTVDYDPDAEHDDWEQALGAVEDDARPWLQQYMGLGVTGHKGVDDKLLLASGGGENGKTTVLGASREAMGSYATMVPDRALVGGTDNHPTELMKLRGARFGLVEETPEKGRLNTTVVKKIIGTERMTARYVHRDTVEWEPTHTVVVSTNHVPLVEDTDHGTWRRLVRVAFPFKFVSSPDPARPEERQGDKQLKSRVMKGAAQQRAVLRWLVDGAISYHRAGQLPPLPPSIQRATDEWRRDNDVLGSYIAERLEYDPGHHIPRSVLFADFNAWLRDRGHPAWSDRTFMRRLKDVPDWGGRVVEKAGVAESSPTNGDRSLPPPPWVGSASSGRLRAWVGVRFSLPAP